MTRFFKTAWHRFTPATVLLIGMAVTVVGTWTASREVSARNRFRFETAADDLVSRINTRVRIYIALLEGTAGILGVHQPDAETFERYVASLGLERQYPGIQGIGFAQRVDGAADASLVRQAGAGREEILRIWPDPAGGISFPIVLLAPSDTRNRQALGYDMYSEPIRRHAMDAAWRRGQAAASGKVTLVQEIDQKKQAGFLIYRPIYQGLVVPTDGNGKEQRLLGFVYSPFRADDLFQGIIHGRNAGIEGLRVYDGDIPDEHALLHHSGPVGPGAERTVIRRSLDVAGRTWTILAYPSPTLYTPYTAAAVVLGIGSLITALLGAIVRGLENERASATRHAVELTASERAVRENERRVQAVLDASIDAIVVVDEAGTLVEMNPAAEAMFGRERGASVGRTRVEELVPDRLRTVFNERFRRNAQETLPPMAVPRAELTGLRADGTEFPVEIGFSRIVVNGRPLLTGFIRDITARRENEAEIRRLHAGLEDRVRARTIELEDANQQLEAFTYSVSHDLRGPLRHIHGFSVLLADSVPAEHLGETARESLARIQRAVAKMDRLIEGLLTLSRSTRAEMQYLQVSMQELVQEAVRSLEPESAGRAIEWQIDPLPDAEGDPALLGQVWTNLLSNAVKYTRDRTPARIHVFARREDGFTEYHVQDNGVGFDMRYADKLFGVFQRLHRETDFPGTGIGLANVARIVKRHGGKVRAEGEVDRGATFVFSLPLLQNPS